MKCTTNVVQMKSSTHNIVYKIHYYNNNLTDCQTATFTSMDRAFEFVKLICAERSVPMVYFETIDANWKRKCGKKLQDK